MKAIVWTKYGGPEVLRLRDVEKPIPKDDEVLVKIHATTVTAGDCEMRSLKIAMGLGNIIRLYNGVRRPKKTTILGQEYAGEIESVGKDVSKFKVGDQIFGSSGFEMATYAEYKSIPAEGLAVFALKPANMTYEEAATIPAGGFTALHFLRKGNIQPGQKIIINGAGGSIGTVAVQLCKYYGAEVFAVDSTEKLDMLRSIGADHTYDFTKEDFTKSGEKFDVIFDVVGKASYSGSIKSLNENGLYLMGNPTIPRMIRGRVLRGSKKFIGGTATNNIEDLIFLRELIEDGKIRAVIDRRYPLEQVADAHRYVETGEKIGNVVINVV